MLVNLLINKHLQYLINLKYSKVWETKMFCPLSHKPYKNVAVEYHVFELELLLVLVLVDEGCLKLSLLSYIEFLHLDLL